MKGISIALLFVGWMFLTSVYSVPMSKACPTKVQLKIYKNGKVLFTDEGSVFIHTGQNLISATNGKIYRPDSLVYCVIYK